MWTSQIKPSTLLAVMTAVVLVLSAAVPMPKPCKTQLKKMKAEVETLLNSTWENIRVPKPTHILHTCPKEFFCLAEKVLKNITGEPAKTLSRLTTELNGYNKKCPQVPNCTLNTNQEYFLRQFLIDVNKCVNYSLLSKQRD